MVLLTLKFASKLIYAMNGRQPMHGSSLCAYGRYQKGCLLWGMQPDVLMSRHNRGLTLRMGVVELWHG